MYLLNTIRAFLSVLELEYGVTKVRDIGLVKKTYHFVDESQLMSQLLWHVMIEDLV